jgi:Sulfatase
MTLVEYVFFFPILKNFFLTVQMLSQNDWGALFHNISNFLVFMMNAIILFFLYWLNITFVLSIIAYGLYSLKCPQYLIKIILFLLSGLILGYLYTDMGFYGYMHRHIHQLFDAQLFSSPFFFHFLRNFLMFIVISIFILFISESFYLRFSIRFLDKIFVFICTIVLWIFCVLLALNKFQSIPLLPTYLKHFAGIEILFNQPIEDDFFYVENRPAIHARFVDKFPEKKFNIMIVYLDHFANEQFNIKNMPFTTAFKNENIFFLKHIAGGVSEKEFLFTLFYGLPITYIPSVLAHKTPSILLQFLQDKGYHLYMNHPSTLYPFSIKDIHSTETIAVEPFIAFYKLNIHTQYLHASYQYNDEIFKQLVLKLQKNNQFDNTIIIFTGLNLDSSQPFSPLIIHWPRMKAQMISNVTTHYDILSTLTGIKPNSSINANLFTQNHRHWIPMKYLSSLYRIDTDTLNVQFYNKFNSARLFFNQKEAHLEHTQK